jgi:hypothetical protein
MLILVLQLGNPQRIIGSFSARALSGSISPLFTANRKHHPLAGSSWGFLIPEKYRHSLVCITGYADFSCSVVDVETGGSNSPMQLLTILIR